MSIKRSRLRGKGGNIIKKVVILMGQKRRVDGFNGWLRRVIGRDYFYLDCRGVRRVEQLTQEGEGYGFGVDV